MREKIMGADELLQGFIFEFISMQTTVKLFFCSSAQMIMKSDLQPIIIF